MKQELESNKGDKHFPGHHMWTYCIFLGKYTASDGTNYDLGIYDAYPELKPMSRYSNATVFGNEPWEYSSGQLIYVKGEPDWIGNEIALEVVKRANAKGINAMIRNI